MQCFKLVYTINEWILFYWVLRKFKLSVNFSLLLFVYFWINRVYYSGQVIFTWLHKLNFWLLPFSFWEMIFIHLFCDNFWTIFSLILTWSSYPLFFFFSFHCFWSIRRKKNMLSPKLSQNGCSNIIALSFLTKKNFEWFL